MSIDYLGQLVQQLCADSKHAEAQEQWLQQYMSLLGKIPCRMPCFALVHNVQHMYLSSVAQPWLLSCTSLLHDGII
jgi:hypothetical protein